MNKHYLSFDEKMKEKYGCKIYKITVDGGFTCPNRDGTLGRRGCIFCLDGSGSFCPGRAKSIKEQIAEGKEAVKSKNRHGKYMAYFQSYTGTYDEPERLRRLYKEAMTEDDIVCVSIATRPDCLPQSVTDVLEEVNKIKPVTVELGLQTVNEKTAEYIRRGYANEVYEEAVKKLKSIGIETVTHMIIGLPGEKKEDAVKTAEYIGKSGADGIKIQLMHVLRGTDLEKEYERGKVILPTLEEYTDTVEECIRVIPPEMTVHRLTGDGDKRFLIAPMWSADKKRVLNYMKGRFERDGLVQGEKL